MTKAAITPGIHPAKVSKKVIINDPQPWSITARGGKMTANITRKQLIEIYFSETFVLGSYLTIFFYKCYIIKF